MNFPGLKKAYGFNKDLAKKGVKMFVGTNAKGEDIDFIIGRSGNELHEEAQRRYSDDLERARYNPERRRAIIREIVVDGIFFGWENMLAEDGKTYIESTRANRIKALEEYDDLVVDIMNFANKNLNYQTDGEKAAGVDAIEESEKN